MSRGLAFATVALGLVMTAMPFACSRQEPTAPPAKSIQDSTPGEGEDVEALEALGYLE